MSTRQRALALYRALLREARLMPTENRRAFVAKKARLEFEASRGQTAAEEVEFSLQLGEVQLDNVRHQQLLLNQLKQEGNLKS